FGACNDSFGEVSMVPIPYYVIKYRNIKNIECIQVMGDSMEPVLCDGGLVVIDRSETAIRDGKIYVFRHDGMIRVKQLVNINGGIIAKSYNASYKEEVLIFEEGADFEVLGRAIWEASNL
ncbi:S24 family peptidase, partial [Vibrio alfacsensis]